VASTITGRRGRGDVRLADVRDPTLASRLTGGRGSAHGRGYLGGQRLEQRRARNVRAAQTVLTAAAAERSGGRARDEREVYGARPDNPVPLPEDAPLLATPVTRGGTCLRSRSLPPLAPVTRAPR